MATSLAPEFENYLVCNRVFLAPAVGEAIAHLAPPQGGRVLDVGTGGGGALPPLATAVGEHGVVVAADRSTSVLDLAAGYVDETIPGLGARIRYRTIDLSDPDASLRDGPFDLIWASDVLWSENVGDPVAAVTWLTEQLLPGGTLAVFCSNYYEATFLPGRPDFARWSRAASERRWKLYPSGPRHHDRHLTWLQESDLNEVALTVFPRVATHIAATDPPAQAYLESVVWPEILESVTSCGADIGMPEHEREHLRRLLAPGDPSYVLRDPGHFIVHPALLVTGRRRTDAAR